MLLKQQRQAVELAWQLRCSADTRHQMARIRCDRCWRQYFSKPGALLWPFAAGILLTGLGRYSTHAVQASGVLLSIASLVTRAMPLIKRFVR